MMRKDRSDITHRNASYFCVKRRSGVLKAQGDESAQFGHKIAATDGRCADGIFAEWRWDGEQLTVINDRYGIYPIFWFQPANGGICISSSLVKLLSHGAPTDLDIPALSVFFRLGTFVGDDTPFKAIKTIPPNAVFKWSDGTLQCHGRYPDTAETTTISRNEAIDQYIDLFAKAVAKRTPPTGKIAVPISGGRDSRHILLELHRTGREPDLCVSALNNPPNPNEDPEIGALLCHELGFRHITIKQQLSLLQAERRKNRETHFCAPAHGWYLTLADCLNGGFNCVYDGLAGDVLSQSSFLTPALNTAFRSGDTRAIARSLLFKGATESPALKGILDRKLQKQMTPEVACTRLATEIEKHLDAPNPVASFFFWNRTRRMTSLAPYSLLADDLRTYTPFLDHDLFDFMSTLPSEMLLDRRFHDDAIARAYPAFAHVPYADHNTAPSTDDSQITTQFYVEAMRKYLARKPWDSMRNLAPRAKLLAGALSQGHIRPWVPLWVVYLDQIESLIMDERSTNKR